MQLPVKSATLRRKTRSWGSVSETLLDRKLARSIARVSCWPGKASGKASADPAYCSTSCEESGGTSKAAVQPPLANLGCFWGWNGEWDQASSFLLWDFVLRAPGEELSCPGSQGMGDAGGDGSMEGDACWVFCRILGAAAYVPPRMASLGCSLNPKLSLFAFISSAWAQTRTARMLAAGGALLPYATRI